MQNAAFADHGFAIPARPLEARPRNHRQGRVVQRWFGLPPLQEASLVGLVCLGSAWALAELALLVAGV
jgi:hypothetical protein